MFEASCRSEAVINRREKERSKIKLKEMIVEEAEKGMGDEFESSFSPFSLFIFFSKLEVRIMLL